MRTALAAILACLCACSTEPQAPSQARPDPAGSGQVEAGEDGRAGGPAPAVVDAVGALGGGEAAPATALAGTETDAAISTSETGEGEAGATSETGGGETGEPEPDPLLPTTPEPGTAEADAELLALLDESTLTQEEFERGFGRGGPKLDGEGIELGPNARTRGRPEIRLGHVEGPGAEILATLVEGEQAKLATCLGMALTKDASATGSLTLRALVDGKGGLTQVSVAEARVGGSAAIQAALGDCLAAVVERWTVAKAAGKTLDIPLSLSTKLELDD